MKKNIVKVIITELVEVKWGYTYIWRVGKRERGRKLDSGVNRKSLTFGKPREKILLLLYYSVQVCSSLFRCYFKLPTQIHFEILFNYSFIYYSVVIIFKYLYNWYQILDLGFKPINGYNRQLRRNGGTCWRVRETQMMNHG